ncbi:LysR substrate-binding domain-containing protein, partial [Pseudomonadota bacterium]
LEQLAHSLERGWEAEVSLVVDAAFPNSVLMPLLKKFADVCPRTRLQLSEVVMSGADEALLAGTADLVIAGNVPQGFLGDAIIDVEFVAVAHCDHPLHKLGREITSQDLRQELQVVVRDSGLYIKRDIGWLGAEHRWTVSGIDSAAEAVSAGLGFAWLPRHEISSHLDAGLLEFLPLREGGCRVVQLYMIYGHPEHVGPATQQLADLFTQVSALGKS